MEKFHLPAGRLLRRLPSASSTKSGECLRLATNPDWLRQINATKKILNIKFLNDDDAAAAAVDLNMLDELFELLVRVVQRGEQLEPLMLESDDFDDVVAVELLKQQLALIV
ncbi:hypothetical protein EVAR_69275_1 [Eumeta japonica]|uniref:Uncharacterized protein n=1 Tax=Eumeta variegata TaxID=151549 RepID=A0A4C1SYA4_EUMVA|nr:hypothetical protein EVAR_69275_1 [Eumeta japonica]